MARPSLAPERKARSLPPPAVRRPPRAGGPERPQTLEQLERELAALQGRSPWAVLGLKEDADADAAHAAFLAMSKRYHPHAYAHHDSPAISRVATELFIAHKRAYAALSAMFKPRSAQDAAAPAIGNGPLIVSIPPSNGGASSARAQSLRPAVSASALNMLSADEVRSPRRSRRDTSPVRLHNRKSRADAEAAFATALKLLAASRFSEAAAEFERACAIDPERSEAEVWLHVCRARELMANGQEDEARAAYRVVLDLDPAHQEAHTQIEAAEVKKRPGLMSRWFGSEED